MQLHLSPRHIKLTAAIHQYAAEKILHLEDFADDILAAHVVLMNEPGSNPKKQFTVKVHLAVPGPDVHAEDCGADLYAVLDKVTSLLARQLRKRRTAFVDKPRKIMQRKKEALKRTGR